MIKHIYHYNTPAEQQYFLGGGRDLYNLIAINGNIVSYMPAGIASFITTANKDFFIDPQTHAFQHATINLKRNISKDKDAPPEYEFKPSIEKLAKERIGPPFSDVIDNDRPISFNNFYNHDGTFNNDLIESVCRNVINFQLNVMYNSIDDETKEFLDESDNLRPSFIVAPYFYLSSKLYPKWMDVNCELYRVTKELHKDSEVFFELVLSKEAFANTKYIVEQINGVKPDGVLLWVDDFIEEEIIDEDIKRFITLLKGIKENSDTIYNLHGGYFSALLCHEDYNFLLEGVGHSVNYGEHRNVIPVGGGIPMARFYYPDIHSRLRFGDAIDILRKHPLWMNSEQAYKENVCKCKQCIDLLNEKKSVIQAIDSYGESNTVTFRQRNGSVVSRNYPTKEAKQYASWHYLFNKAKEFRDIESMGSSDIIDQLDKTFDSISPITGDDFVAHLLNWREGIKDHLS